ncbi:MAG: DUF3014 domain-containing protein [Steroidobacteraceae bacterium]
MNRILIAIGAGLIVIAGSVFWYKRSHAPAPAETVAEAPAPVVPATPLPPPIEHPLGGTAPDGASLPALKDSDAPVAAELGKLFGTEAIGQYLVPDMVVRRLVATVDNLPRRKLPDRLRPVQPLAGKFAVTRTGDATEETIELAPESYARYEPLVKLLQRIDTQQVAATYKQLYPLFQQQYEEIGFPDQYFNDRLVAVIDHLLQTPEVGEPVQLVRPNVFYEFADPQLEARSAGQKTLIRMGKQNADVVKAKLRDLRGAITSK